MLNQNKVSNFVNNIEFLSHENYQQVLGQIITEFKSDEWLGRAIVCFLIYEKFDCQYDVFIETTKDTLNSHRTFPNLASHDTFIEIIYNTLPYYDINPKLFEYIVPIHPYSLICLYKAKGTSHIFDDYLKKLQDRPEYLTDELFKNNLFPKKLYGVIHFTDEENFSLTLNSSFYNSIFYRFQFNTLDYRQDFLPKKAFFSRELLNQELNYELSVDKEYLHIPKLESIKGKMLPVIVNLSGGLVWYSLNLRNKHELDIPLDIDLAEVLEGAISLDPLTLFKMINIKESFKDADKISEIIQTKKNRTLREIFTEYYNEKYLEKGEVKINGTEIYKSFINSDDFIISKAEISLFNQLIQEQNLEPDKVKFLLFYNRMLDQVPTIAKPVVKLKKVINKILKK